MSAGFRKSDMDRVEMVLNHDLPAPYSVAGEMTNRYQCLKFRVIDPMEPQKSVCDVTFDFVEKRTGPQPSILEIERVADEFAAFCRDFELTRGARAAEAAKLTAAYARRMKARADAVKPPVVQAEKTEMEV